MAKVLVVEDDAFLVSAYRAKLTKAGFTVEVATDGEEALVTLRTFVPDVIIMDVVMPRMDGFATLAEIKKQDAIKNIPVIIASNLGQDADMTKAQQMGAVGYITKSDMSMDEIIKKLNDAIAGAAH